MNREIDWEGLDWLLKTGELAKMFNVSASLVSRNRKRYAPETIRHRKTKYDWGSIDWEGKRNVEISKELGCTQELVAIRRSEEAPHTCAHLKTKNIKWEKINWLQSTRQIARYTGAHPTTVSKMRNEYAPQTRYQRGFMKWQKVDWSRKTTDIAKDMGVALTQVSRARKRYAPETRSNNSPDMPCKKNTK